MSGSFHSKNGTAGCLSTILTAAFLLALVVLMLNGAITP